jgi:hypothetical protein
MRDQDIRKDRQKQWIAAQPGFICHDYRRHPQVHFSLAQKAIQAFPKQLRGDGRKGFIDVEHLRFTTECETKGFRAISQIEGKRHGSPDAFFCVNDTLICGQRKLQNGSNGLQDIDQVTASGVFAILLRTTIVKAFFDSKWERPYCDRYPFDKKINWRNPPLMTTGLILTIN